MYGGEPYEYVPMGDYVVRAPGVCGGEPTFKYTRINVSVVIDRLADGETVSEVVEDFMGRVPKEAILEALSIAAGLFKKVRPPKQTA